MLRSILLVPGYPTNSTATLDYPMDMPVTGHHTSSNNFWFGFLPQFLQNYSRQVNTRTLPNGKRRYAIASQETFLLWQQSMSFVQWFESSPPFLFTTANGTLFFRLVSADHGFLATDV